MHVLLVGCGRMGGALLRGWREAGVGQVSVIDPGVTAVVGADLLGGYEDVARLTRPLCVILAVKPAMIVSALVALRPSLAGALVISVAPGVTLAAMRQAAGAGPDLVRTMPNTPAAIGKGAIGVYGEPSLPSELRAWVETLLAVSGTLFWLDDEASLDAVTAISGSGPAYFFRFTEALAEAGRALGLTPEVADQLASLTFTGAAALLEASGRTPSELRTEVTSPGGTTAAALNVFNREQRLATLVHEATEAAVHRSREMGGSPSPLAGEGRGLC